MGVNTCLKDIHTLYPVQYLLLYVCIQDFFVPIISICFLLGSFPSGQLVIHHCLWSLMWAHLCFSTKCMNRDTAPSLDFFSSFRNPHRALDASWGRGTGTTVVDTKGTIGYMLMQLTYALWSYLISVLEPTLHPTVDYCQIDLLTQKPPGLGLRSLYFLKSHCWFWYRWSMDLERATSF